MPISEFHALANLAAHHSPKAIAQMMRLALSGGFYARHACEHLARVGIRVAS